MTTMECLTLVSGPSCYAAGLGGAGGGGCCVGGGRGAAFTMGGCVCCAYTECMVLTEGGVPFHTPAGTLAFPHTVCI